MSTCVQKKTATSAGQKSWEGMRQRILQAARCIAPLWPLQGAIACNPLVGLVDMDFWQAVEKIDGLFHSSSPLDEKINAHMIKWCQAFFDEGQAMWPMPGRDRGFYKGVLAQLPYDKTLLSTPYQKRLLDALPQEPLEMLCMAFEGHSLTSIEYRLAQLPGWAGYVLWHSTWREDAQLSCDLCEFLALRVCIEMLLANQIQERSYEMKKGSCERDLQKEVALREQEFERQLLTCLLKRQMRGSAATAQIAGQLVFCIDCRSEPLRESLERHGPWKTYGAAGFFGLPVYVEQEGKKEASCPVIVQAKHLVCVEGKKNGFITWAKDLINDIYKGLKYHFGAPFALVEACGPLYAFAMLARLFPSAKVPWLIAARGSEATFHYDVSIEQRAEYAFSALMSMGMHVFSPLVVFCGHGSTSENNPHKAALQCGACAARSGGINAQLLATMLNDQQVRAAVAARGLLIPPSTQFLALEHDTTLDTFTFLCPPQNECHIFDRLQKDLRKVSTDIKRAKGALFPTKQSSSSRARNWAEVRPEWGLARNGAFIIGDGLRHAADDLVGRSFLHSYDFTLDTKGQYLQSILEGPLMVAHWINMQYFFSSLYPHHFGSGSKITMNIAGKIGVMQGNASDLMTGLPLQSLFSEDAKMYHEPLRLLTIIEAPKELVQSTIAKLPKLCQLLCHQWLKVIIIDPPSQELYHINADLMLEHHAKDGIDRELCASAPGCF